MEANRITTEVTQKASDCLDSSNEYITPDKIRFALFIDGRRVLFRNGTEILIQRPKDWTYNPATGEVAFPTFDAERIKEATRRMRENIWGE